MSLLQAEGVTKTFDHNGRAVDVLRGVDLRIDEGDMLGVVGPSGAGKSTLLHILGTLERPSSGSVTYDGDDITKYSEAELAEFRNRTIGFVFQFHHLLPDFSALENIMLPGRIAGKSPAEVEKAAADLLDQVGLSDRSDHRPGELSGGEQQRVALARALVMKPRLVLADEPTGNLDSGTSEQIHDLMSELNRTHRVTFMVVTHSQKLAERMSRVVHMRDGRVEMERAGTSSTPAYAKQG